ncbi:MAG: uroporphyrinogen decarboxylase family protein [Kiritimatiellaeota bacterium]|nr:uroporphyrinogen decarboxylase family protein [Kiritimatiellota bacterium]
MRLVFEGKRPPYVPWEFAFTQEPWAMLRDHFGSAEALEKVLDPHTVGFGGGSIMEDIGNDRTRDSFGVVWNRSKDKDIGVIDNYVLPGPSLNGYAFPDPLNPYFYGGIDDRIKQVPDRFRIFYIGFSLFERAWTMRGMENLLMDFVEHPAFVEELFTRIADYNIAMVRKAVTYDIDAVYFGDDWGQQQGLIMGKPLWDTFIKPQIRRMYAEVRKAGKFQLIHSCGDVQELFDDLVDLGLNCFNPFQPEVMDVAAIHGKYRGRLSFWGGLSTQQTLPRGTADDVRAACRKLLDMGQDGGYIFAPAHAVESDVPLANILAFIDEVTQQNVKFKHAMR